jgi:thiosulfate dehydrogenase
MEVRHAVVRTGRGAVVVIAAVAAGAAEARTGQATYAGTCAACHDRGVTGAPALNDASGWQARLAQPREALVRHAVAGFRTMPPRGGNPRLSDAEVADAVAYMVDRVSGRVGAPAARVRATTPNGVHVPPSEDAIPPDKYGDEVRLGKRIFTETYRYARRYAGNELACSNCHLEAGRRAHAAPLWGAYGVYPAYRAKNDRNNTFEERIQGCFQFSMNGIAPALDTPEMRALVAYAHFLANGVPVGVELPGRGFPQVPKTGSDPNPTRGEHVYKGACGACHGGDGQGQARKDGGHVVPPLWGRGAYNRGAGFHDNQQLAGFILANMPPVPAARLTDQEALDVAAFINLQWRPPDPRRGLISGWFQ